MSRVRRRSPSEGIERREEIDICWEGGRIRGGKICSSSMIQKLQALTNYTMHENTP